MPPMKNKHRMPDPLPQNTVLTDLLKQKWIIGTAIGKGGFGEIYSAAAGDCAPSKETDYCYAVKIEPMENGPLFVERMFYLRAAKKELVTSWIKSHNFKSFGMPLMYGHGSHEGVQSKCRFLVMDRFSRDLDTYLRSCNKLLSVSTVLQISTQILDVLEFIHSKGYVHGDVKAQNILLGYKKGTENQVYLVDFGLVEKVNPKKDPKKRHNGTIEFLSRDMHEGGVTLRGDLEVLAYNIVFWLTSKLPWEGVIKDCLAVQKAKEVAMQNVSQFLKTCFGKKQAPEAVSKFFKYVSELQYEETPDYSKARKILLDGLRVEGVKLDSPLSFSKPEQQNVRTSPRKASKRRSENEEKLEIENLDSSSGEERTSKKRRVATKANSKSKPLPKEKVSWRDCPTAQASGVIRAGEYVSKTKKASKPLEPQNGEPKTVHISPRKASRRSSENEEKLEIENLDSSSGEERTSKKRRVTTKSYSNSKPLPEEKVSWRDCPTAQASGVIRAGEYVSKTKKASKPLEKQNGEPKTVHISLPKASKKSSKTGKKVETENLDSSSDKEESFTKKQRATTKATSDSPQFASKTKKK